MTTEERGDFRYLIFVEYPPGWIPAWPQPEYETEPGAIQAARYHRNQGENVIIEKYDQHGVLSGEIFF